MKVSVIIPAYNEERYIAATLTAILQQSFSDYEIIVVDNNSSDGTSRILAEYGNKIKIVSEPRQGLLFARSAGLQASEGDVIAQLDADCLPPANWIENAMQYFKDEKVMGVSGPYRYYDAPWYVRYPYVWIQQSVFRFMNWYVQKMKRGAILLGGNAFIRTSALLKAGGYNTALQFYAEDTDTAMRIAQYGRVVYSPRLVVETSARRYRTQGFFTVINKYFTVFFALMRGKPIADQESAEATHPR